MDEGRTSTWQGAGAWDHPGLKLFFPVHAEGVGWGKLGAMTGYIHERPAIAGSRCWSWQCNTAAEVYSLQHRRQGCRLEADVEAEGTGKERAVVCIISQQMRADVEHTRRGKIICSMAAGALRLQKQHGELGRGQQQEAALRRKLEWWVGTELEYNPVHGCLETQKSATCGGSQQQPQPQPAHDSQGRPSPRARALGDAPTSAASAAMKQDRSSSADSCLLLLTPPRPSRGPPPAVQPSAPPTGRPTVDLTTALPSA